MGAFKNNLKKILPPPVNSFMREVNRIVVLEEQNQKLIRQLMETIEKQKQILEQQKLVLQQQSKTIELLEKRVENDTKLFQNMLLQIAENEKTIKQELEKQQQTFNKQFLQLDKTNKNLSSRIDNTNREISYRYLKGLHPDQYKDALEEWYYQHTMMPLDLDNPKTFNEKIQWLKLYDSTPEKTRLADKYLVRDWVKEKIGEEYLIPLLGVWDKFDDIDFDTLPDKFVLKANHGSGWNVIVKDKESLNIEATRTKFNNWMKKNFAFCNGLELHYKDIEPKIIAEQYHPCQYEYQFWCFNGIPKFVSVIHEPHGENAKVTYDMGWNQLEFVTSFPKISSDLEKPDCFETMIVLARNLSETFAFVRVDFLHNEKDLFLGEMTFTPASGLVNWKPEKQDKNIGDMLTSGIRENSDV